MHHNFNQNYLMHHGCSRTNEHSIQKRKKNEHRFYFEIVVMSTKKYGNGICLCKENEHRFYFARFP